MSEGDVRELAEMRPMRHRKSKHLPDVGAGEVPYALCRTLLRDFGIGNVVLAILETKAWQEMFAGRLAELQRQREQPGKEKPWYTTTELESIFLLQRVAGLTTYQEARDLLAGDRREAQEARRLLGFDRTRGNGRRRGPKGLATEQWDGIPSKATMSRYLKLWDREERRELYEQLLAEVTLEHLRAYPEFRDECLTLFIDGSTMPTHYTAPKIDKETGEVENADKVTAWDAGYVGGGAPPQKRANGWNLVTLVTRTGLPVAHALPRLGSSEKVDAVSVLGEFAERVRPELDPTRIGILTADGGFQSPYVRRAARQAKYLENVHYVTHHASEEKTERAERETALRIPIVGYDGWYANGHREVFCKHGHRATKRIEPLKPGRELVVRVEGKCADGCKPSISLRSGDWRRAEKPTRYVRANPDDPFDTRDWGLGNGLTYNDLEAKEHGRKRRGRNEGFHGTLSNRFDLTQKRWLRYRDDARIEVAVVYTILHVIAMEHRRRLRLANEPPPLARAA